MSRVARSSTEAEIDALDDVCERLVGFGIDVSLEWVDGYLTALVASRRAIDASEWLPAMFGDAFERAFADPVDVAQALAALTGYAPKVTLEEGLERFVAWYRTYYAA